MRIAALALLAGCLDISSEHHCMRDEDCIAGDVQGRCEPTTHCSFPDVERCGDGYRYDDRSGAGAGTCVVRGPASLPIDLAADTTTTGCAPAGTRDAFIEVLSTADQVLVADATAAVSISLRDGPCPSVQPAELACQPPSCAGVDRGLVATAVEANRLYCMVVEETVPNGAAPFTLRILPAGRFGQPLTAPSGSLPSGQPATTTCSQPAIPAGSCGPAGPASAFVMPVCGPSRISATVTPGVQATPLDRLAKVRTPGR